MAANFREYGRAIDTQFAEHRYDDALAIRKKTGEKMQRQEFGIAAFGGKIIRGLHSFFGLGT